MGVVIIPTGQPDEPFILVHTPYIESGTKQHGKVLRNLEILTNDYLRERIIDKPKSPVADEIPSLHGESQTI